MSSSQQDSPSFVDALKTIKLEDFKDINKIPCSRNALLYGMAAGVAMGAIRFMSKRKHIKKNFFFTHNLKMGDV
ncbi:hypothetical protein BCV71DRAFT_173471 [Rhizopus microsporus]|uniref:Cytochrome c oxidase assembly protein COX20, mitochondrial n=1 Tax=Rhizopus microsporus TaxID=58291 RepID=A0A1X0SBH6_RHIZD|nr:hypothetical protein BCV71DRAFT_173471 [Rhizopus microsporus]